MISKKAPQALSKMDIETYNVCNLRCIMCPYPAMKREKVLMSLDLFKKIIDDAARSGIREIGLNFYNEPLIDRLLFERIKYAKAKGLKVCFSSNGTLLTDEMIDSLLDSGLDLITFSFDGATREVYEQIRVGADFEKTRNNIINMIEKRNKRGLKKPTISVYLVAQKGNYRETGAFRALWQGLADRVSTGEVDSRKTDDLLPDVLRSKARSRRIYPCRRLFEVMTVMSNGQVALCCFDFDGSVILGDLNRQTISEIWNSAESKKIRQAHLESRGDKIKLCHEVNCSPIYRSGAYEWWGRFDYM
jgi:MoaA/NifB/PqqE/SkfB family radical SAM enzyme